MLRVGFWATEDNFYSGYQWWHQCDTCSEAGTSVNMQWGCFSSRFGRELITCEERATIIWFTSQNSLLHGNIRTSAAAREVIPPCRRAWDQWKCRLTAESLALSLPARFWCLPCASLSTRVVVWGWFCWMHYFKQRETEWVQGSRAIPFGGSLLLFVVGMVGLHSGTLCTLCAWGPAAQIWRIVLCTVDKSFSLVVCNGIWRLFRNMQVSSS